jgi:hypothetical protein
MDIAIADLAFLFCVFCAGVMGFAIQRGATCTVAAVDEFLAKGTLRRLASLIEASGWVAGGLLVAQWLHVLPKMPSGYALDAWTLVGGALLGVGALVNGACVFGAIARFGSGEWAYAATPAGFYLGCLSVVTVFGSRSPTPLPDGSPVLRAPAALAVLFVLFALWRLSSPFWRSARGAQKQTWAIGLREALAMRIWSPHAATTVIGITFFFTVVLLGAWAYTDLLADLARGLPKNVVARCVMALALLAGAGWGGWTAGRFRSASMTARKVLTCAIGGALMGWGTLLIPGSNDGLILIGMPLLWTYAWVAFLCMCLAIAAGKLAIRRAAPAANHPTEARRAPGIRLE